MITTSTLSTIQPLQQTIILFTIIIILIIIATIMN